MAYTSLNMEKLSKPFRPTAPQEAPWLVFFSHGKRGKTQSFYNFVERRSYVKNIPEMSRKICLAYSQGWLIMIQWYTDDIYLLNPTTLEKIQLPPLPPEKEFPYATHQCLMSSEPTKEKCMVVFVNTTKSIILFCHPGEMKWRKIHYKFDEDDSIFRITYMGKFYFCTYYKNLAVLDFNDDPVVRLVGIPPPASKVFSGIQRSTDLVESCGEIFLVSREYLSRKSSSHVVITCNVYKVDFAEKKWVHVQSIGSNRAFFLCTGNPVSCPAVESGVKGDSIYYCEPEDPSLYRFDMANRTISMERPFPNLMKPWESPHWIFL